MPEVARTAESPWQRSLGDEFGSLHPRLHAYFSAIPPGRVGRGSGTFDAVGTPRRWLRPALRVLQRHRMVDAPRVRLTERFDDAAGRQHAALTLESRLFGRIYEYSGHFDYRVEPA